MSARSSFRAYFVQCIISAALISGCNSTPPPPPPAAVTTVKPIEREVTDSDVYSGRLESPQTATIAARVEGIITRAAFNEGALVNAGDVLFSIDDRPFKADVTSKESDVVRAQAALTVAQAQLKRFQAIKESRAISEQDYDQAVSATQQAQAQLEGARAALAIAKLNLEWTQVTAPIAGRVGKKLVTEGNLVKGGNSDATRLTSITSIDPMYAYINIPERSFLKYQPLAATASMERFSALPCGAQLENESNFPHQGTIDFVDNHIDPSTGTIQIRCTLPNKNGELTPGLFVRVQVQASKPYRAILVPDVAVGTDQNSRFLLTVGADGNVKRQIAKLGALFGKLRVITEGIATTDSVIVSGLQSARPGSPVAVTEAQLSPEGEIQVAAASSSAMTAQK